jgi:hypothetical protein
MKTCPHLEPIEEALAARGIAIGDGVESPYGAAAGIWYPCDCVFDETALRARIRLADCVEYSEYFGFSAGSDAEFHCTACQRALWGCHPRMARKTTPRLT